MLELNFEYYKNGRFVEMICLFIVFMKELCCQFAN